MTWRWLLLKTSLRVLFPKCCKRALMENIWHVVKEIDQKRYRHKKWNSFNEFPKLFVEGEFRSICEFEDVWVLLFINIFELFFIFILDLGIDFLSFPITFDLISFLFHLVFFWRLLLFIPLFQKSEHFFVLKPMWFSVFFKNFYCFG